MAEEVGEALRAGSGEEREPGGCGFEEGVGHAFAAGGKDEESSAGVPGGGGGLESGEGDLILET
jgi:hypothetical protein